MINLFKFLSDPGYFQINMGGIKGEILIFKRQLKSIYMKNGINTER